MYNMSVSCPFGWRVRGPVRPYALLACVGVAAAVVVVVVAFAASLSKKVASLVLMACVRACTTRGVLPAVLPLSSTLHRLAK